MDREDGKLSSARVADSSVAVLCSLVVHLSLLLLLACWVFASDNLLPGIHLSAQMSTSSETAFQMAAQVEPAEEQDLAVEPSVVEIAEADEAWINALQDLSPEPFGHDLTAAPRSPDGRALAAIGGKSEQSHGGASFFGRYAGGNRFVFVVDSSQSMEGERWNIARKELIECLRGLRPNQEFLVICFDHRTTLMFGDDLSNAHYSPADGKTVAQVARWLRSHLLGHDTMPAIAMALALSLKPDGIFLLSDGELRDNTVSLLTGLNARSASRPQVPIHTIHLMSPVGWETLHRIAEENSGSFVHLQSMNGRVVKIPSVRTASGVPLADYPFANRRP
ncbi:MAG: VWA domain-containing protein [Pirellulaceae bacterium]|nr:VWA domain-containing protein [Pirellulaceae bacterium]